eukprot:11381722-Prorocentrum_lima.AAC.1
MSATKLNYECEALKSSREQHAKVGIPRCNTLASQCASTIFARMPMATGGRIGQVSQGYTGLGGESKNCE